jgi:hypothetical protein
MASIQRVSSIRKGKINKKRSFKSLCASSLTILLLATGCGANRATLLKEINEFDQAVQTGTEAIAAYYTTVNDQEVQVYVTTIALNPNCEVGDKINYNCLDPNWDGVGREEDWYDTPLKQLPIPMESLQARLAILKEVSEYSKNLAALAGDESAEQFKGNVTTLTERLKTLEDNFRALQTEAQNKPQNSLTPADQADLSITKKYLTPIGKIIGLLGARAIQEAQWEAVRQAIIDSEEPINTILTGIAEDLRLYNLAIITGADQRYTVLVIAYNDRRFQLKDSERFASLQNIVESQALIARSVDPAKVPNNLKDSHGKLVKLAESGGSPKDLAEVKASLERFKADVEQLVIAVKQLAQLQGDTDS